MTTPWYDRLGVTVHHGHCLDVLHELPDASVDAVCTDPPYELGFMGRQWDSSGIAFQVDLWRECLRVLKPGGHLMAFGASRTYHRLAVAIEDAGFHIRDSLHWIYGTGMPKGQDIAKSIDRRRDDRQKVLQVTAWLAAARDKAGWTTRMLNDAFGYLGDRCSHWMTQGKAASVPMPEHWAKLRELLQFDDTEILPLVQELTGRKGQLGEAWSEREQVGQGYRVRRESQVQLAALSDGAYAITAPASDAAKAWQGWNTSLKPAHEPIVLARKTTGFESTVANVLMYGTGALNIDACRIEGRERTNYGLASATRFQGGVYGSPSSSADFNSTAGRWPTNLLFGHSEDCGATCTHGCPVADLDAGDEKASRFFPVFRWTAKAGASERPVVDGIAHPTVKPLALMRWLVRLVTPPDGVVLDPFLGSGTTAQAARAEGFRCIGVEKEQSYLPLIRARLDSPPAAADSNEDLGQFDLFGLLDSGGGAA